MRMAYNRDMILVVNSGSSSLKYKLFGRGLQPLAKGLVERVGQKGGPKDHMAALSRVLDDLRSKGADLSLIRAVGHRVVHGGEEFVKPALIDKKALSKLRKYSKLAPLHNPPNLKGIEAAMKELPDAKNVAVFDTAFHATLPDHAYMYALPYRLYEKDGIRKYGFHGTSHKYVAEEAAKKLRKPLAKLKLVTCHLGSGASVTAIRNGKSVDTSMGFTPLEGLTMSSRCGDIDPAIPLRLIMEKGMTAREVDRMLNFESGLIGICGLKDMRDVLKAAKGKGPKAARARLAIDMFTYDVARYVAQYDGLLGGADAVVFTAGIGENSPEIRRRVMAWLKPGRRKVLAVPTDEELAIAREAARLL